MRNHFFRHIFKLLIPQKSHSSQTTRMEIPRASVLTPILPSTSHLTCFPVKPLLQASYQSVNSSKISFIADDSDGETAGSGSDHKAATKKPFEFLQRKVLSSGQSFLY